MRDDHARINETIENAQESEVTSPGVRNDYASKSALGAGILHLTTGLLCISLQIAAIILDAQAAVIGAGIWCGVLFSVTGVFGIVSSCTKRNRFIITFLVLSILSAVFIFALLVCSGLAVALDAVNSRLRRCSPRNSTDTVTYLYEDEICHYITLPDTDVKLAIDSLLMILSVIELVFAIWSSVFAGSIYCCYAPMPQPGEVIQARFGRSIQPQVVFIGEELPR